MIPSQSQPQYIFPAPHSLLRHLFLSCCIYFWAVKNRLQSPGPPRARKHWNTLLRCLVRKLATWGFLEWEWVSRHSLSPWTLPCKGVRVRLSLPRSFIKLLGGKCWSLVRSWSLICSLSSPVKKSGPPAPSLHRRSYKCWLPLFPVCSRGILEVSRSVSGSELLSSEDTRDILGQVIVVGAVLCTLGCFSSTPWPLLTRC